MKSLLIIQDDIQLVMKKEYPERMDLSEVWPIFEAGGLIHLSTVDGDHPRVRMVSFTVHGRNLWVATRSGDDKVSQIRNNSNVEFTLPVRGTEKMGCLRATAEAYIMEDTTKRDEIASLIPWFSGYWKSSKDPNYTLIRIDLKKILFDHHETSLKYTIEV